MIPRSSSVLLAVLLSLAACSGTPPELESTGETARILWAILPVEGGAAFDYEGEGCWHPDADTVRTALDGLRGYLKTQREIEFAEDERDAGIWHEMVWGVLEKLPAYNCQVVGIVESGRKLVYLNFVHYLDCEPRPDDDPEDLRDWTQDPHVVSDGGDHYWNAQYDPATDTFVSMGINGEA